MTTTDTTPTTPAADLTADDRARLATLPAHAQVVAGDDGRATFARMGLDVFTVIDAAAIVLTPGGTTVLAYLASDVWRYASADRSATEAARAVDRAAADARTALADGYRVNPGHVVGAAARFAEAVNDRQAVADAIVSTHRIARSMVAPAGCKFCAAPADTTTHNAGCPDA